MRYDRDNPRKKLKTNGLSLGDSEYDVNAEREKKCYLNYQTGYHVWRVIQHGFYIERNGEMVSQQWENIYSVNIP